MTNEIYSAQRITVKHGEMSVEASWLGLPPGTWPEVLSIQGRETVEFVRSNPHYVGNGEDRELVGIDYVSRDARFRITIWND